MASPYLRKIVSRTSREEEHVGKGPLFSWWCVTVTTVNLECGHQKVYRGDNTPAKTVLCKICRDAHAEGATP